MRPVRDLLGAALILVVSSGTTAAHHSAAAYDVRAEIRIDGTVTRFDWGNPHVYIEIEEAAGDSAEPRHWLVELAHPATVSLLGLDRASLEAGDEISILANPPRNTDRSIASLVSLEIAGQTVLDMRNMMQTFLAQASSLGTEPAESIEGVWVPGPSAWQDAGFDDLSGFELTEAAEAAASEFDPQSMSVGMECLPEPIPSGMISGSAPSSFSIEVEADTVTIRGEADAMVRTIRLDTDVHLNERPSPYGDSIGRWEGDVLVVDTVDFEPHPQGIAPRVPSGPRKHVIERFGLNPDGTSLAYSFEVRDPDYLAGAIGATVEWLHYADAEFRPVACTLENARRFLAE